MSLQRHILRALDFALSPLPGVRVGDEGARLDPTLVALLAIRRLRSESMKSATARQAREDLRKSLLPLRAGYAVGSVTPLRIPGAQGELDARLYEPAGPLKPAGLVVYFHGGGFVVGDLDTHDDVCRLICRGSRMVVVSVAYRLAPEHPFPAAVDDARAALDWARGQAQRFGLGRDAVALAGDSAGANLAIVTAHAASRARDSVRALLLFYPGTDLYTGRPSRAQFGKGLFLTTYERNWMYEAYLPCGGGEDPRVSPLRDDLDVALPPMVIVTAELDMLRDEGEAYAETARRRGDVVEFSREKGLGHGFVNLVGVSARSHRAVVRATRTFSDLFKASRADSDSLLQSPSHPHHPFRRSPA